MWLPSRLKRTDSYRSCSHRSSSPYQPGTESEDSGRNHLVLTAKATGRARAFRDVSRCRGGALPLTPAHEKQPAAQDHNADQPVRNVYTKNIRSLREEPAA